MEAAAPAGTVASAPPNLPEELRSLFAVGDDGAFDQALEAVLRTREHALFRALGRLARELHDGVQRLAGDVESNGLASRGVGAVRTHLAEVVTLSEQAAHRTLDIGERLLPDATRIEREAGELAIRCDARTLANAGSAPLLGDAIAALRDAERFAGACREGLTEIVVAQTYQDLSGQRMKQVVEFMGRVETVLIELLRIAGGLAGAPATKQAAVDEERVSQQDEVDRLLGEFGF